MKQPTTCLFIGGSCGGQVLSVVGEEVQCQVVIRDDFDKGMITCETELYSSVRVVLHKQHRMVKVMRKHGISDAELLAELKNWEFASDGIFRIQTCPNCGGKPAGGHVDCPTCEGSGTVRVVSPGVSDNE
jgi:hypothetical protein